MFKALIVYGRPTSGCATLGGNKATAVQILRVIEPLASNAQAARAPVKGITTSVSMRTPTSNRHLGGSTKNKKRVSGEAAFGARKGVRAKVVATQRYFPWLFAMIVVTLLGSTATVGALGANVPPCEQWGIDPRFVLHQQPKFAASNIEFVVVLKLKQNVTELSGEAAYYRVVNNRRGPLLGKGPANGSIRGAAFEVTANWSPISSGVYRGTIRDTGHITGKTYDRRNANAKADWYTPGALYCWARPGVDRPGYDYRNFDLPSPNFEICRDACINDQKCQAYSYVKPGIQSSPARCWLKTPAPLAIINGRCIAGEIRGSPRSPDPHITGEGGLRRTNRLNR